MISYLSDKFAGEAYKFVDIDYQALAELRARKMYNVMKLLLDEKTSNLLFTLGSETFKASPHVL